MMDNKNGNRFPLRLDDVTRWKIESWYKKNGCQSRNEFVVKAVNFYADYLAGQVNSVLFPPKDIIQKPCRKRIISLGNLNLWFPLCF